MKKTTLVTGGAGFIGSALVERLLDLGYRVRILDNLSTGKKENLTKAFDIAEGRLDFLMGDCSDFEALKNALLEVNIVFHCADNASVGDTDMLNVPGITLTRSLLKAMANSDAETISFCSSSW